MESLLHSNEIDPSVSLVNDADDNEVHAWKEVHSTLLMAVQTAQEAVAIQRAQRRYWLEEIAYNLDDSGQPTSHSAWNRPIQARTDMKEVKKKKIKLKTAGTSSSTTTIGAAAKKQKVTKSQSTTQSEGSNVDLDSSTRASTIKKSRKRNDSYDNPVKAKKQKQTKIGIKRSTFGSTSKSGNDEFGTEEGDFGHIAADFVDPGDEYSTTLHRHDTDLFEAQRGQHEHEQYTSENNNNLDAANPNWTHEDDVYHHHQNIMQQGTSSLHPYAHHHGENYNDVDVDDDDTIDDSSVQQQHLLQSHSLHSTSTTATMTLTPTIRNYTSLQDITMNDDDSDDEDRF